MCVCFIEIKIRSFEIQITKSIHTNNTTILYDENYFKKSLSILLALISSLSLSLPSLGALQFISHKIHKMLFKYRIQSKRGSNSIMS